MVRTTAPLLELGPLLLHPASRCPCATSGMRQKRTFAPKVAMYKYTVQTII